MIGISKERLDKAKNNTELDWDTLRAIDIVLCLLPPLELDPWLPIDDNTPKDTRFLVLFEDGGMEVARLVGEGENKCWISNDDLEYDYGFEPTHYKKNFLMRQG